MNQKQIVWGSANFAGLFITTENIIIIEKWACFDHCSSYLLHFRMFKNTQRDNICYSYLGQQFGPVAIFGTEAVCSIRGLSLWCFASIVLRAKVSKVGNGLKHFVMGEWDQQTLGELSRVQHQGNKLFDWSNELLYSIRQIPELSPTCNPIQFLQLLLVIDISSHL